MKRKLIILAALLAIAASEPLFAQNAPGGRGRGYGGPPANPEERAARQAACGNQCQGQGPCVTGEQRGPGWGRGAGRGLGRGPRDGSGPRAANGTCPATKPQPRQ